MSSLPNLDVDSQEIPADAELVAVMTRIAENLERLFAGTVTCVALLAVIAVCEVMRSGIFGL